MNNIERMNLEQLIIVRGTYASINEFAVQNQIPNPMVYKWVNGTWMPSVKWIVKLAEILKVEPHDVLYAVMATAVLHPKQTLVEQVLASKKK